MSGEIIGGAVVEAAVRSRAWRRLVVLSCVALLMTGCSAVRFGYNHAPDLAYWWFDGYVDFKGEQSVRAHEAIDDWFQWHRRVELPVYAGLLAKAREQVTGPVTAEQACQWFEEANHRVDAALERALPGVAEVARRLSPQQLSHLERKYADINEELADKYLQRDPEARTRAQLKRALEPIEMIYGRISSSQRERIAALALQTPFDPVHWIAERRRRQQDTLQTLTRLGTEQASAQQAVDALRALVQRSRVSTKEDYRAYQQRLIQFNCGFAAEVHNLTTPEQRRAAAEQLKDWEDDARALSAESRP
jgi:hypothetical protein